MDQIPVGRSTSIHADFLDGESTIPLASCTLEVIDDAGVEVVEADTVATEVTESRWRYLLPAVDEVNRLTATWTGLDEDDNEYTTTTTVEVVGGFYFTIAELRAQPYIDDDHTTYSTERLLGARRWVETLIEDVCGTSFVERYRVDVQDLSWWRCAPFSLADPWPRRLLSVMLGYYGNDTPLTEHQLGQLTLAAGRHGGAIRVVNGNPFAGAWDTATVRYVAGYSTEPPADLKDAALKAAATHLVAQYGHSSIPARATAISGDDGTFRLRSAGGTDHPTGYDDEDAVIIRYRNKVNERVGVA